MWAEAALRAEDLRRFAVRAVLDEVVHVQTIAFAPAVRTDMCDADDRFVAIVGVGVEFLRAVEHVGVDGAA